MYEFESRSGHYLEGVAFVRMYEPACGQTGSNLVPGTFEILIAMYFVYVLNSLHRSYIYVGLSSNLKRRIDDHNKGFNKTTKPYAPFELIHLEEYGTRPEARKREVYLKSGVGKEYLKTLLRKTS